MIVQIHRIIQAIRISIVPQHSLTGGEVDIGGDEAANLGVVVSALQVIKPGFFIIHIAAIAEGLLSDNGLCQRTGR